MNGEGAPKKWGIESVTILIVTSAGPKINGRLGYFYSALTGIERPQKTKFWVDTE
jgi:hypothetical protein